MRAPVIGISRHRMTTDGEGVTTLVGFHGCPLRCRYCLNPHSFAEDSKRLLLSPEELYERVKPDQLYFLATGGGVTFGGGEPLLYPRFLRAFRHLCGPAWRLCVETSLSVPWESVEIAAEVIDEFIVDCKDTDPEIYARYTGRHNGEMLENLRRLVTLIGADRVTVRVPLIPTYNSKEDCEKSVERLAALGVTRFDRFTYRTGHSAEAEDFRGARK